jgi:hypothetical protein
MERVPLNGVVWYPGGSIKKSRLLHNICVLLFHLIPAYFIDFILFVLGYPTVWVSMRDLQVMVSSYVFLSILFTACVVYNVE